MRSLGRAEVIASLSGIRGIVNVDLELGDVARFAGNFAKVAGSSEFLLARDPRSTGPAMVRAAASGLLSRGATVYDCGVISTPALFRESRVSGRPGIMATASHNEPEFNGLKFVVGGAGIGEEVFRSVMADGRTRGEEFIPGSLKSTVRPVYVEDLVSRFGAGSCAGVRVALDLGGGAATSHATQLFRRLGCEVVSFNDTYGVFNRKIDPVADELTLLRKTVVAKDCDVGYGFDCDGDRLVVVDSRGRKRTGDFMLSLALSEMLRETGEKRVVVSLDTTQAIDEVARGVGAEVYRSKVGEANVVGRMKEKGARLGGEGSSGGLIDGEFNYCRDSLLAGLVIAKAIEREGRKFYDSVPAYHQARVTVGVPRNKVQKGIKRLAAAHDGADVTDGVKIAISKHEWVLVRPSGTEDLVRVSVEAGSSARARSLAKTYSRKLAELSR